MMSMHYKLKKSSERDKNVNNYTDELDYSKYYQKYYKQLPPEQSFDQDDIGDLGLSDATSSTSISALFPLVLSLLPAFIGVIAGEPVGIFATDTVILIVVGWVLWNLSEGMWILYKARLDEMRLEKLVRNSGTVSLEENTGERPVHNNGVSESAKDKKVTTEAVYKSQSQSEIETKPNPDSKLKAPRSLSPSKSQPQLELKSYSQLDSQAPTSQSTKLPIETTLILYLSTPLLGGLILHYSRSSLSAGTKLVNSFNIFLYVVLELIRNITRVSNEAKSSHISDELVSSPSFINYQKEHNAKHELELKYTQDKLEKEIRAVRAVGKELNYLQRKISEFDEKLVTNQSELYSILDNAFRERNQLMNKSFSKEETQSVLNSPPLIMLNAVPEEELDLGVVGNRRRRSKEVEVRSSLTDVDSKSSRYSHLNHSQGASYTSQGSSGEGPSESHSRRSHSKRPQSKSSLSRSRPQAPLPTSLADSALIELKSPPISPLLPTESKEKSKNNLHNSIGGYFIKVTFFPIYLPLYIIIKGSSIIYMAIISVVRLLSRITLRILARDEVAVHVLPRRNRAGQGEKAN